MNKWIKVSPLIGAAVLSGTLYFTSVSWAQDTNSAVPMPTTTAADQRPDRKWGKHAIFSRAEKLAMLAEALGMKIEDVQQALLNGQRPRELVQAKGLTQEAFRTALRPVVDKHLQQAVQDGRITQQQADRIGQRLAEGRGFWQRGGQQAERGAVREAFQSKRQTILAEALGMTPEALQNALAAGQTPRELAQAKGMDETAFRAALQQAAEKHIQQALTDGRITQAQADRIRDCMAGQRGPWQWLRAWQRLVQ